MNKIPPGRFPGGGFELVEKVDKLLDGNAVRRKSEIF